MKEIIQTYIVPIGIILTFLASLINVFYSRRNIKTTKYIETITTERIKWLEMVRQEATDIISNIYFTLRIYSDQIQSSIDEYHGGHGGQEEYDPMEFFFDAQIGGALGKRNSIWSETDFIKNLNVFKFRLNQVEDKDIIEIVDFFIEFYNQSKYKSQTEILKAKEKIDQFTLLVQNILKIEWEKCKKETRKK